MADDGAGFQRPPTAQEAVLAEFRRSILNGQLEPGAAIRQDVVARRFGVSRVPVREALKILEGEGLVTYQPHRGFLVAQLSVDEVREVYHVRRILEDEALRLGVPKLTEELIAEIERTEDELETAGNEDLERKAALNRRFHFLFFESAGMPRLVHQIRTLWDASDAYRAMYYMDVDQHDRVHSEHRQMIQAARERDIDKLIELHEVHRANSLEYVTSRLASHG